MIQTIKEYINQLNSQLDQYILNEQNTNTNLDSINIYLNMIYTHINNISQQLPPQQVLNPMLPTHETQHLRGQTQRGRAIRRGRTDGDRRVRGRPGGSQSHPHSQQLPPQQAFNPMLPTYETQPLLGQTQQGGEIHGGSTVVHAQPPPMTYGHQQPLSTSSGHHYTQPLAFAHYVHPSTHGLYHIPQQMPQHVMPHIPEGTQLSTGQPQGSRRGSTARSGRGRGGRGRNQTHPHISEPQGPGGSGTQ